MNGRPLYISLLLFTVYSCGLMGFSVVHFGIWETAGLWFTGFFAFTLVEYLFHRFFFHMRGDTKRKAGIQYSVHGNHHANPQERTGVMMKPFTAIAIIFLLSPLFYAVFEWSALALLPGFLAGYSCYLLIHFAIHAFKPPRNFLRFLWKLHTLHHFHDDTTNYGVSSPLWDIVFGTYQPAKKIMKSKQHNNA